MRKLSVVRPLLSRYGQTYASEAGIRLRNGPSTLFQTLCLSLLLSARIRPSVAVSAMRALRSEGWTTPAAVLDSTWARRAEVLNESGYARYDERTSTMLADTASLVQEQYHGDLRRLRDAAGRDPDEERRMLKQCKGIGDVGADVFAREVQGVWPELAPFFGDKALEIAKQLDLPTDPERLRRTCRRSDLPRLAAALMRVNLAGQEALDQLRNAA